MIACLGSLLGVVLTAFAGLFVLFIGSAMAAAVWERWPERGSKTR